MYVFCFFSRGDSIPKTSAEMEPVPSRAEGQSPLTIGSSSFTSVAAPSSALQTLHRDDHRNSDEVVVAQILRAAPSSV